MRYFLIISALIIYLTVSLKAEVRFVSKTGSSKPPFTSWATAADRIQKAIDISQRGDTIYVGNGTYVDTVRMTSGIALIGSGMDSCIIDSRPFTYKYGFYTVTIDDSCVFEGFNIIISDEESGTGIVGAFKGTGSIIKYNKITSGVCGIYIADASPTIRHNLISMTQGEGISLGAISYYYFPQVDSNYISIKNTTGIRISFGSMPVIRNNIILVSGNTGTGFISGGADSVKFYNNLIFSTSGNIGIQASSYNVHAHGNVVTGQNRYAGINAYYTNVIENNCVNLNSQYGIIEKGGIPLVRYNNVWGKNVHYYNFVPDSTNLSVDPMFVNPDSMDFHLQMFSPLIHAGNPNIKNVDGTRSDIGIYGGLYGEAYNYKDLAPNRPQNLSILVQGINKTLKWNKNTESDFSYYNIYRDTVKNFILNKSKFIIKTKDTIFTDFANNSGAVYYKLTAVDSQDNESAPSEEAGIITGEKDTRMPVSEYQLYQNYPNPFNPATKISFRIKNAGYVKIHVYDIKGELIKVLVNGFWEAGFHEVEFNAAELNLASGIYLYKIDVKNENRIPKFTEIKKMLLIK